MGALLVSPYTVVWGSYVWAGGAEVSEFCLLVVFPVSCVSSISGKFLCEGTHAICFLPLVSILEKTFAKMNSENKVVFNFPLAIYHAHNFLLVHKIYSLVYW
jgi:hypothetical protein